MDVYAGIKYDIDNEDTTNAVCDATCTTANDLRAKAIIVVTKSGQTAQRMSKFHPRQIIVAATPVEKTMHQLALSWGVFPVLARMQRSSDELLLHAIDCAKQIDAVVNGHPAQHHGLDEPDARGHRGQGLTRFRSFAEGHPHASDGEGE